MAQPLYCDANARARTHETSSGMSAGNSSPFNYTLFGIFSRLSRQLNIVAPPHFRQAKFSANMPAVAIAIAAAAA